MPRLSPDAQTIVNVLQNVGTASGYVRPDHTQILFEKRRHWQAAIRELMQAGFITTNERGDIALTPAGQETVTFFA